MKAALMKPWYGTVLSLLILITSGCANSTQEEPVAGEESAPIRSEVAAAETNDPAPAEPKPASKITAEIQSWDGIQKWVTSQKGKVVVVDIWSTFCVSCMQEFPHFVALHDRLGNQVACASVDIDYYGSGESPETIQPRVVEFLTKHKATTTNFVSSTADEEILEAIDVAAIPAALVFDQSGKLRKVFSNDSDEYGPGGFTYEKDINPLVEELASSSSAAKPSK